MMTRIVTPGYASPEQHEGNGRFSTRADVYSLGATLHRLLSGRTPPVAAERAHRDELPALWRINPTVSRRTSDAVGAALALDPAARPATVAVLLDRLGIAVEGLGAPDLVDLRDDPTSPPEPPPPPVTEYRSGVDAIGRSPRHDDADDLGSRGRGDQVDDQVETSTWRSGPDPATEVVGPATERSAPSGPGGAVLAGAGPVGGSWVVPAPAEPAARTTRPPRVRAPRPAPPHPRRAARAGVRGHARRPALAHPAAGARRRCPGQRPAGHPDPPARPGRRPGPGHRGRPGPAARPQPGLVAAVVGPQRGAGRGPLARRPAGAGPSGCACGSAPTPSTGWPPPGRGSSGPPGWWPAASWPSRSGGAAPASAATSPSTPSPAGSCPPAGPPLPAAVVILVCLGVAAAGLAFHPEAWPLR
jgi:hypothetical protein